MGRKKQRRTLGILSIGLIVLILLAVVFSRFDMPGRGASRDVSSPEIVAENALHFSEAPENIEKEAWVWGEVDHVFESTEGNIFVNFCLDFRTCSFSAVIFADDIDKFSDMESWGGRTVSFFGQISTYEERPQMVITDPMQVRVGSVPSVSESDVFSGEGAPVAVTDVVDGDTIRVEWESGTELVRLIGIDTPEVAGPHTEEECFGPEASAYLSELLEGREVVLSGGDPDRDQHGRLRRYVFMLDDTFVNALLIEEGYASAYAFTPHAFMDHFAGLETQARAQGVGQWSGVCEY